jgi:hypothetical protein
MLFNPTIGMYQNKKMREKRIKQVNTKSPIKILFLGLMSNGNLLNVVPSAVTSISPLAKLIKMMGLPDYKTTRLLMEDCPDRNRMSQKKFLEGHSLSPLQLDFLEA